MESVRDQTTAGTNGQTLNQMLQSRSFEDFRAGAFEAARSQPTSARARWLAYQLLCIDGDWTRALKQLQVWATLEAESTMRAQLHRGLVTTDAFRTEVFAGLRRPGFVNPPPAWLDTLVEANVALARGNATESDRLREAALDAAEASRGEGPRTGAFAWLADSDTRLGPACEFFTAGGYRWIPFEQMRALEIRPAGTLTDVVWVPARVAMRDGSAFDGYMPTRYAGSEHGQPPIRLARETHWTSVGKTAVIGAGQKVWSTDAGDWGLLEIGDCRFAAEEDHDAA